MLSCKSRILAFANSNHRHITGAVSGSFAPTCERAQICNRFPDSSTYPRRHLTRRKARIWPPPDDREDEGSELPREGDLAQDSDGQEGDAAELARWLLRELAVAGSNKKKSSAVRLQLLSLDIPLASAIACLSQLCHFASLTSRPASSGGEAAGRPLLSESATRNAEQAERLLARSRFEKLKQQEMERLGAQLPSKRATYDHAMELMLEYAGEMMALAAGSTSTIFERIDTLARDALVGEILEGEEDRGGGGSVGGGGSNSSGRRDSCPTNVEKSNDADGYFQAAVNG